MRLTGGIFCYIAGLAAAPFLYGHELFILLPFVLAGLAFFARNSRLFPHLLALFLLTFGLNQYALSLHTGISPNLDEKIFTDQPVLLEANINAIDSRQEQGLIVDLEPAAVILADKMTPINGVIRIFVANNNSTLQPGDKIRLQTRVRKPRNFATPGAFDYARYLARRQIIGTGYARRSSDFARIHSAQSLNPLYAIKRWRHRIREQINNTVSQQAAPLVSALAIGDRGAMETDQRKLLAESGLAHLFAISGLHLGLVAAFLYLLFRSIYLRTATTIAALPPRRILPPLLFPIVFAYMILTGAAISTLRALIMLGVVVYLCCLSRRSRPVDILIAAAFIILIFDPLALFEPSFQLSFAGAAGIILLLPYWQTYLLKIPILLRIPTTLLAVTLSASLATLPFVLLHFKILAPAGPLLNLVAVPLVSFVIIPVILVAILLTPLSLSLSSALFQIAASILLKVMAVIEYALSFSLLKAKIVYIAPFTIGALSLFFLVICLGKQTSRGLQIAVIAITALFFTATILNKPDNQQIQVIALDVGQGDATLLRMPDRKNYLIDGGGLYSRTFDTGERLIAPALGHLGIDKLDAVILTHDHPDHRKGLLYILQNFPVKAFWCALERHELHPTLQTVLANRKVPIRTFPNGWTTLNTSRSILSIFVPGSAKMNHNDRSLCLYAGSKNDGLLLTGDLEQAGVRNLVSAASPGVVSLLKIPHHGSRKSDPRPLLEKFTPANTYISVGYDNHYGLPDPAVLNTLEQSPSRLWRTDRDGSLRFVSNGDGWAITRWKKGLFR